MKLTKTLKLKNTRSITTSILACILACCLCFTAIPSTAFADVRKADIVLGSTVDSRGLSVAQCPNVDAEYAAVMGADGTMYFERSAYDPTQIASITKIMTAIVALDTMPLDTIVTVSDRAASVGESSASLQAGDTMTLETALKALLLSSGNDAAVAIAETGGAKLSGSSTIDDGSEEVFVDAMNQKASDLGLVDTVFRNPHGLDDEGFEGDQHSCASDVATMAKTAMLNPTFRSIVATPSTTIQVTHENGIKDAFEIESTDQMLGEYEGACGIKTGFTNLAGYSFAGAANRDGKEMYAIVINSTSEYQRFLDAETLLDWVFEHNVQYPLAHTNESTIMQAADKTQEVPVVADVAHSGWIDKTVKATLADPNQSIEVFDLNGNISQSVEFDTVEGDVHVGDKLGTLTFKQRNNEIAKVDLVACEDVPAPNLFEGIGIWWDRLFRGFSGQPKVAESVLFNQTPLINDKTI